jgi:hypothetical protein
MEYIVRTPLKYKVKIHKGRTVAMSYEEEHLPFYIFIIEGDKIPTPNFHIYFIKEKIEIEVAITTLEIINYIGQKLSPMINYQNWKTYGKYLEELKDWLTGNKYGGKAYKYHFNTFGDVRLCYYAYNNVLTPSECISLAKKHSYKKFDKYLNWWLNEGKLINLNESPQIKTSMGFEIWIYPIDRTFMTPHFHVIFNEKYSWDVEVSLYDLTIVIFKGLSVEDSKDYADWYGYGKYRKTLITFLKKRIKIDNNPEVVDNFSYIIHLWNKENPTQLIPIKSFKELNIK